MVSHKILFRWLAHDNSDRSGEALPFDPYVGVIVSSVMGSKPSRMRSIFLGLVLLPAFMPR
jgi:hypothetical protein